MIHRLLVIRDTARNRAIGALFQATLKAAYPADPWLALAALAGDTPWPGSAMLWARDKPVGGIELRARDKSTGGIELRATSGPRRARAA